ncbi:glutamate--tRNA ligase [Candidatus Peregrinibacteria bacterium]|nr:glutamate--tRNA ligase [Candidatus Peregrinibacteria bacterium]
MRTRFPPSPTGFLHVGGLRTALYNFLLARKNGGKFIFRIEDTDQKRAVAGAVENLIETLKWAGLSYDEGPDVGGQYGPYIQSERTNLYKKYAEKLVEMGAAYPCFCTAERLDQMRKEQEQHKMAPKYDRHCLHLSKDEIEKLMTAKTPFVLRQRIPDSGGAHGGSVMWKDLIRSAVTFKYETIDDQVLLKSDGFPTYHLANVVDDHLMEITHVVRGEEWLSSTPKHILLYKVFGWKIPEFGHLPLLLNKDRSKLSKRQGDVAVEDYRRKGYLPEAVINFIALLGWHPGGDGVAKGMATQEIFTLEELIQKFSLDKVHKAGAVFDIEKLDWVNWQWRRKKFEEQPGEKSEKLLGLCSEFLPQEWLADKEFLKRCLITIGEKAIKNPQEAPEHLGFYFKKSFEIAPELIANPKMKVDMEIAKKAVAAVAESLESFDNFTDQEALKIRTMEVIQKLQLKNGQVLWPTRVALTGEAFSPGVFEVLWALGKEESMRRLKAVIAKCKMLL